MMKRTTVPFRGLSRARRLFGLGIAGLVAVSMSTSMSTPAQASGVDVQLAVSAGTYLPTGAACTVSVPAGSNGLTVLDAAKAKGCIDSYETRAYSYGTFVSCLDGVCDASVLSGDPVWAGTYWGLYRNGQYSWTGIGDMSFQAGDVLGLAYEAYAFP